MSRGLYVYDYSIFVAMGAYVMWERPLQGGYPLISWTMDGWTEGWTDVKWMEV